ncbi:type II toxin-antitoxin system antitoxin SocA domain-containing protein [uncultured Roseivirga sp.]|uniref:type II toxin-antitoxin system antitoxin SocA domain-containing protein n=1 Tax=uncultured Roseivirga sp. TaxID=543088 RepID=UPI0030D7157C
MKSPITGKEMKLSNEWRTVPFRKEEFEIKFQFYLCEDSGEQFTTTALDELNMRMVYNQYRVKHHIPQPDEIKEIRDQYDLSAVRMGEILGFGPNTYGLYEKGDLPSLPNANLLKMASDPAKFMDLAKDWNTKFVKAKETLIKKIERLTEEQEDGFINFDNYLMGGSEADEFTGYKKPSLEKLTEMVVYFAHKTPSYKTKMNKLLFYGDFCSFKETGMSISGSKYRAISYGPVHNKFETLFEHLAERDALDKYYDELPDGGQIAFLTARTDRPFKKELFSEKELEILERVADKFQEFNTKQIVIESHKELGWLDNQDSRSLISYHYAIDLKGV